jgi:DNA invertase Pin-like site-specific DNA recombinase
MSDDSSKENTTQQQQRLSVSYVRARCDSPQQEEQLLLAQQQRINVYVKQHDLLIVPSFVDRHCGAGTGPALTQMYEFLAEHREVRCVIVDTLDRLMRNLSDLSRVHEFDRELHIAGNSMAHSGADRLSELTALLREVRHRPRPKSR